MVVVFPLLGRAMSLSDAAFGLWAGTAVNDTSSVVATGYAFSEAAGDFATMVKRRAHSPSSRRCWSSPPSACTSKEKKAAAQSGDHGVKVNMKSVFPWFILGFLAMSILCSVGVIPAGLATTLKSISKFLMVAALAAIGLNTNFAALCKSGAKPMLHGFIISLLVVLVAIAVEYSARHRAERHAHLIVRRKDEIAAVPHIERVEIALLERDPAVEKLLCMCGRIPFEDALALFFCRNRQKNG